MRRTWLRVHMWVGMLTGLYVCLVSVTGAALVFRIDMQRALHPELFTAQTPGPLADPVAVMESVSRAYPEHRLSGVEAPTTLRPTYLAYVTRGSEFRTVLIDPVSTDVLGELPARTAISTLQALHFNLLGGRTGRTINGAGAAGILLLGLTGLVIWWPGVGRWRSGVVLNLTRDERRLPWAIHRVVGIWSVAFIVMWAVTGLYLAFPSPFRAAVNRVSPLTVTRSPQSLPQGSGPGIATLSWGAMIERARAHADGAHVARVVLPVGDRGAFLVMFSDRRPTPAGSELASVYLDQFTGERLAVGPSARSRGDALVASLVPWHVGGLGGQAGRVLWFCFGLAPAVLVVTGLLVWWRRVVRPRWRRRRAELFSWPAP